MKLMVSLISMFLSISAFATKAIVTDGEIVKLASTSFSSDDFYVSISGGTGDCANRSVVFPQSSSPSQASHNRAFSIALSAFMTGNTKVQITSFDDTCMTASIIEIQK